MREAYISVLRENGGNWGNGEMRRGKREDIIREGEQGETGEMREGEDERRREKRKGDRNRNKNRHRNRNKNRKQKHS